jgi:8-oxo-dGTP diphosphatase
VHWNNPKPVTATLIPFNGGLVLVKRKFEPFVGDWCLPGGFIEAHEHPGQSAAREVFEETGLTIRDEKLIDAAAPGHMVNVVILFYEASSATGTLVPGDDASEVDTFTQENLPRNIAFELHRKMILHWFDKRQELPEIIKHV